jgi:dephospho-CoA kinase
MTLLGITGGVGMGKSTSGTLLQQRGIPVADTDAIAREIVEPGEPALAEIATRFGAEMLDGEGRLRRDLLAEKVFANEPARRQLELILHPRIRAVWQARAESWRAEGQPVGAVLIPLLFETGAAERLDATVCVACTGAAQRERLRARGWSETQIDQRRQAQWPIAKKLELADFVIWTEGSLEVHAAQLERIVAACCKSSRG